MDAKKSRLLSVLFDLFVPFLRWLPELRSGITLRADIVAGVTVALVLIPQSMAYAQLAGLPAYYGLYAAFLPPMVAAIFGSSRQLATGPVAVVSLLSAAALEPLATAGGESFIAYSILLALMVGLFQVSLGLLRLGVLLNFLSHPVVLGFTNAAAIIIATSQLGKIFGVTVEKSEYHYETVWNTVVAAVYGTHWPTLAFAILAFTIMVVMKQINPRLPSVLTAVVVTILLSAFSEFEETKSADINRILHKHTRDILAGQASLQSDLLKLEKEIKAKQLTVKKLTVEAGRFDEKTMATSSELNRLRLAAERRQQIANTDQLELNELNFREISNREGEARWYYLDQAMPVDAVVTDKIWRITDVAEDGTVVLHAGGRVVGVVPTGLPTLKTPSIDWNVVVQLFVSAIAIGLIGFMEAISIAKAMAARTRQHLDANQELIGQGLANITGSFFQSYAISGSFSRSAVNIGSGAVTGFSSVVTSIVVAVTLLWLTPLLYHLPQATLAAVIMMAVIGLVNIKALRRTWQVQRNDGVVAITTFVLTLAFAPHLQWAIVIGVILSLGMMLYRTMRPRIVELSRHTDGSLRDAHAYGLKTCEQVCVLRFEGSLYFANISYFDDKVMQAMAEKPELRYVIVDGVSINNVDSTGVEMLGSVTERLYEAGVQVLFTRVKQQAMRIFRKSGFIEHVGEERFFRNNELALDAIFQVLGSEHATDCPLNIVCKID
ncbi:MAG: SulP family inorganic anion transporter [Acidiferrobacterales bacterium]